MAEFDPLNRSVLATEHINLLIQSQKTSQHEILDVQES